MSDDPFEAFKKWRDLSPLSRDLRPQRGKGGPTKKPKDDGYSNEYKSNLFKKLKHRAKYINMEYEDTKEIFERARKECLTTIMLFCNEHPNRASPLKAEENKKKKVSEEKKEMFQSDEIKSVYRQIVTQTHPDKLQNESEELLGEMAELYMAAIEAKEQCDFHVLMDVATDLRIEADELSMAQLEFLEKEIDEKEKKIKHMRKDFMWQWYHANTKRRQGMIEMICPINTPQSG